jgi:hypothetical protein
MAWLNREVTTERELSIELMSRELEPREAYLFKTLASYQDMLQSAVHEIMRLEFVIEDLRQQVQVPLAGVPETDAPQSLQ